MEIFFLLSFDIFFFNIFNLFEHCVSCWILTTFETSRREGGREGGRKVGKQKGRKGGRKKRGREEEKVGGRKGEREGEREERGAACRSK